jgi:hypothetical protein
MHTEMYTKEESEGSLRVVYYDSPNPSWSPAQAMFPGIPLTGNAYAQERQNCFTDAQLVGAAQDIEMGKGSGGPKTTSGLMLLSEEAAMKREPRERALAHMYEGLWQHFMDLTWAFRKEKAIYEVAAEGSTVYQRKSYEGNDLLGGVRVKVATRSSYDITLYNKEATGEALQMGLVNPSDPATKAKVLSLMQLPEDLVEAEGIQIQRAEMAWSDFENAGEVPVYDESLFDPALWFAVLGKRWMEDGAYMKQKEVGFDEIMERLSGWEEAYDSMLAQDEQQKMLYGSFPPEQWPQIYERTETIEEAKFEAATAAAVEMGQPPPQRQPTAPPPIDGFLPANTARKIYTVWKRMLPALQSAEAASQVAKEMGISTKALENLNQIDLMLQMRAVIEGARKLAQEAMAGPAGMAPEGAPEEGGP